MAEINTITVNDVDYDIYDSRIVAVDSTPTEGSANPVTSTGAKTYIDSAIETKIETILNTSY